MKGMSEVVFMVLIGVIVLALGLMIYFFFFSGTHGFAKDISNAICKLLYDNAVGKALGLAERCG